MNNESALISAVCQNKDIGVVLSENVADLFVSHADVIQDLKNYYYKYNAVPEVEQLVERHSQFIPETITAPTEYYLDELRESFMQSKLKQTLLAAGKGLKDDSATRVLDSLMKDVTQLAKYSTTVKDINLTDVASAEEHYDALRLHRDSNDGNIGIKVNLKSVDRSMPAGMAPGNLIILLGFSGRGKSWFGGFLAKQAFLQGKKPMIVSMEMTAQAMRDRLYATMGDGLFSMSNLQTGAIDIDDFRTWSKKNVAGKQPFIIVSSDGIAEVTVNTLQAKIDQHRPDLLVVDYIQLMSDGTNSRNETEKIRNVSRDLKRLALRNNIPVIAISAVTASDLTIPDQPPMLEQVAWSRSIQYDADAAIAVHKYDDTNVVELISRKNRFGPDFCVYLEADFSTGTMREHFNQDILN